MGRRAGVGAALFKAAGVLAVTVWIAAAAGCGSDSGGARSAKGDEMTWTIAAGRPTSEAGFTRMAFEKKFFEKFGVRVKLVYLKSSDQIYAALFSGSVDAIEQSPGGLFIASNERKLDQKIIASDMQGTAYAIIAKPDIKTIDQLKGRSIATGGSVGLVTLITKVMLDRSDSGVTLDDLKQINIGDNPARYQALAAGQVDAAAVPADFVPKARKAGLNVLMLSPDVVPEYPRYTIIANAKSLETKREAAVRFLAGLSYGLHYAFDQAKEAQQISAKATGLPADDPSVTYTYDLFRKLTDPDAAVPMDKLQFLADLLQEIGLVKNDIDVQQWVDDSYRQDALRMVASAR
jgi:NitT/TauT family transport system substrate-binding protein